MEYKVSGFPANPLLQNLDNELIEAAGEQSQTDASMMFVHLRDARELLRHSPLDSDNGIEKAMAKGAIVLACAALEANLSHLTAVAEAFERSRPGTYQTPQLEYLRGRKTIVDAKGDIVEQNLKQNLEERLQVIPDLLAKAIRRRYQLPQRSAAIKKLRRTIARRDAIVHPRWERYLDRAGWMEAAEAVDAVELYLQSVQLQLHPYLVGYFAMLGTIPPGWHKHDGIDVGYRTRGSKRRVYPLSRMDHFGLAEVIVREWIDTVVFVRMALGNGVEGDSEGSGLTRAALILLYAMVDAQLAIVSQWRIAEDASRFSEPELNFLNEIAIGIGHDGEVSIDDDHHPFKQRIVAIPRILARAVEHKDVRINLGLSWGEKLLEGGRVRNKLVHSPVGEEIPIVTITELLGFAEAVKSYFSALCSEMPVVFVPYSSLIDSFELPTVLEVNRDLDAVRRLRAEGHEGPILFSWLQHNQTDLG
jgi:hypothetical protein